MNNLLVKTLFFTLLMVSQAMATAMPSYKLNGNTVYRDGNAFAQLRFFRVNEAIPQGYEGYDGIAIYYFDTKEQIWVCPKEGWKLVDGKTGIIYDGILDIANLFNAVPHNYRLYLLIGDKEPAKYDAITAGCVSYSVDDNLNMKLVLPGMFWNSSAEFDIINKKFK